ncbi:MAG: regulatory protein GemA [Tildeniella torsiva UHER 1998/13D]|jgi:phage gp16-like protein|nr:regulatory protein GemA [Tildeniella torsiva UHER 1998/13D]
MAQTNPKQPDRRKLIALIHVAKKQLAIDEGNYRMILDRVTGKQSCAEMSLAELNAVMDRMTQLGFVTNKPDKKPGKKKLSPPSRHKPDFDKTQIDLIRALWINAYQAGAVRNRYESGLNAFVKRMTRVERVEWLRDPADCTKVIEALKAMLERAGGTWEPGQVKLNPTADD